MEGRKVTYQSMANMNAMASDPNAGTGTRKRYKPWSGLGHQSISWMNTQDRPTHAERMSGWKYTARGAR